jgi:RHS repeat-associated protein
MDSGNAYIYGTGVAPIEQVNLSTGATTYLVTDSLGSVRGTVNSSGALTGTASYDAWGNPQATGGLIATTPFGFAGGYTDPTGLIYLINRYYDPATGQFLSVDPEVRNTLLPYAYTAGTPSARPTPGMVSARGTATWALRNWNGSNNGYGDDCTDFASRALHLGGGDPLTWPAPKTSQNVINDRKNERRIRRNGPRDLATLRILAISLLYVSGITEITGTPQPSDATEAASPTTCRYQTHTQTTLAIPCWDTGAGLSM